MEERDTWLLFPWGHVAFLVIHRQQAKSHAELQSQLALSHPESMGYVLLPTFSLHGAHAPWG